MTETEKLNAEIGEHFIQYLKDAKVQDMVGDIILDMNDVARITKIDKGTLYNKHSTPGYPQMFKVNGKLKTRASIIKNWINEMFPNTNFADGEIY